MKSARLKRKKKAKPAPDFGKCERCGYSIGPKGLAHHLNRLCWTRCKHCGQRISGAGIVRHAETCKVKEVKIADRDRRLRDHLQDYDTQVPEAVGGFKRIQQGGLPSLGKKR